MRNGEKDDADKESSWFCGHGFCSVAFECCRDSAGASALRIIGGLASGIHSSLLTNTAAPGEAPILQVFPAWPKDWEADYRLLAPGAFQVTSSMRNGHVDFVELDSRAGAPVKLRNPWPGAGATLYLNGRKTRDLDGELLAFPTLRGEHILLVPRGTAPDTLERKF